MALVDNEIIDGLCFTPFQKEKTTGIASKTRLIEESGLSKRVGPRRRRINQVRNGGMFPEVPEAEAGRSQHWEQRWIDQRHG